MLFGATDRIVAAESEHFDGAIVPQALDSAGIFALKQTEPDLTGQGVRLALISRSATYKDGEPQNNYRPNNQHHCFDNVEFTFKDEGQLPAGLSPHSTAICSILFGEDLDAYYAGLGSFHYQGLVPAAEAGVYEFWHFLTDSVFPHSAPDADIVIAGFGSQFEDWWTKGIDSLAEHYGIVVVAAIGNGDEAHDPPLYPAAGTNVIGVGVVDSVNSSDFITNLTHFGLPYREHSSFGPTADGRCKPDIIAPGNCLAADFNEPNNYIQTGNWSSFATPMVAGTIGLLVQKAMSEPNLSLAASKETGNCVIKSILLNSASKLPYWHKGRLQKDDDHNVPLDYIQGSGMLNAIGAYKNLIAGRHKPGAVDNIGWDLNQMLGRENSETVYRLNIPDATSQFITITLCWNNHYEKTYPFEHIYEKDADLRLELWAIDDSDPNNDYLVDYSDSSIDNLEHIYCRLDPNYSDYEIVVLFSDEQPDLPERYGLAWNVTDKETNTENIYLYDLNTDGIIDRTDVGIMLENWLGSIKPNKGYFIGDINNDGVIDAKDVQILVEHKGQKTNWYKR